MSSNNVIARIALGSNNIEPLRLASESAPASISTSSLPAGVVGVAYSAQLQGVGAFAATGLPPGLALAAAGALSGTPTVFGSYSVTITATFNGTTASVVLVISISQESTTADAPAVSGWAVLTSRTRRG